MNNSEFSRRQVTDKFCITNEKEMMEMEKYGSNNHMQYSLKDQTVPPSQANFQVNQNPEDRVTLSPKHYQQAKQNRIEGKSDEPDNLDFILPLSQSRKEMEFINQDMNFNRKMQSVHQFQEYRSPLDEKSGRTYDRTKRSP